MSSSRMTRRSVIGAGSAALAWTITHPAGGAFALAAPSTPVPDELTGRVIWPRDPAYDEARADFNSRLSHFPAAIVICDDAEDVQHAVRWARREGVPLSARSGGHSYEAFSVLDGGLVVDLSGLK